MFEFGDTVRFIDNYSKGTFTVMNYQSDGKLNVCSESGKTVTCDEDDLMLDSEYEEQSYSVGQKVYYFPKSEKTTLTNPDVVVVEYKDFDSFSGWIVSVVTMDGKIFNAFEDELFHEKPVKVTETITPYGHKSEVKKDHKPNVIVPIKQNRIEVKTQEKILDLNVTKKKGHILLSTI